MVDLAPISRDPHTKTACTYIHTEACLICRQMLFLIVAFKFVLLARIRASLAIRVEYMEVRYHSFMSFKSILLLIKKNSQRYIKWISTLGRHHGSSYGYIWCSASSKRLCQRGLLQKIVLSRYNFGQKWRLLVWQRMGPGDGYGLVSKIYA